ncbi:protein B4 isoform X2 [Pygocentrus nattereri]|uniref:protein B4 isoform X2 n=1 Tax=Pygocentrus nattereri TaxID=42514 RepID=UPI0008143568|nr:protein B4 isoform X2 [Pygocentrus nattereri]
MGPKKAAAETKVSSPPARSPEKDTSEETDAVSEDQTKAMVPRKAPTHPSTMEMVKEALMELDSRKGVSAQAIRTFVREKHPTVDETRVKFMVRRALLKGLESGALVRPANSSSTGAKGRFRLAVRKPKEAKPLKKTREAKENANPNVGQAKAKDAGTEKTKPAKKKSAAEGDKPKKPKTDASASKVAPAKKPKAKKAASNAEEPEPKAQTSRSKGAESGKTTAKKAGKKGAQKTEERGNEGAEVAAAAPKKGKKAAQTEDGQKKASDGEEGGAAAPKASGRKGKKAAEK